MYRKEILPNSLRVVTHDIKGRDSVSLGFWVGVGGRYEEGRLKGAAHFLEHIAFKGSRKYSCSEIKMLIEGVGGTLNAFTSEEQTCFYAKIPSKHIVKTFDVLSDMVMNPKILPYDVKKEKTVIVEEIKMYKDLPQYFVLEMLDGLLWPDHPLGQSLAGTTETVMNLAPRDLREFHASHYLSGNMVVSACGNVDHNQIVRLVKKNMNQLKGASIPSYRKVGAVQSTPRVSFLKKDIEQMHLAVGIPGVDQWNEDRYVLTLLSILLGGNMSSRLFVEIREKRGFAYSVSCSNKTMYDTGVFLIRAGVDNRKIVETFHLILRELDKIKNKGVEQSEFRRARDYLSGQLLLGLEDTMENMLWLGEGMISKNEIKSVSHVIKALERIKKEDMKRMAVKIFDNSRLNLAVVGPLTLSQEADLKKLAGL